MAKSNKLYLILFILGAALIAYSIVPLLLAKKTNRIPGVGINEITDTVGTLVNKNYPPKGNLLMTLLPKNSLDKRIEGYVFNLPKNTMAKIDGEDDSTSYHSVSANNVYGTLVGTTITNLQSKDGEVSSAHQVYRTKYTGGKNIVPTLSNASPVTNTTHTSKRLPSINNTGDILYAAIANESDATADDVVNIGEWAIYMLVMDTSSTTPPIFISRGLYPKWINDTQFVYAKNDGVYLQSKFKNAKNATKIISFALPAISNMKMHVSKSGKFLAWTRPDDGKVELYDISNPRATKLVHTFDVHAFWPAFSPDDEYIAIQAVNWNKIATNPKPRIEIYSLSDYTLQYAVSIDSFVQTAMFLNDWVE